MKPICYDLYCGLGGWSEAFIAEGYECIGFDIEAHDYGTGGSIKRKAASAMIAKIPEPLSRHIARTYKPKEAIYA